MNEPSGIDAQLVGALPALLWLPVAVGATYGPVVWVDGGQRPDIDELTRRLTAIEKQITQLGEFEIQRVYGRKETRWIYAYGRYANAFFLSVDVKAGSFTRPDLTLQPYQSQFVVSFNLEDGATISLLRSIAASQSLLLHFDPVPKWVKTLPPLSLDARGRDYGTRGLQLVRSSLPLGFRTDSVARMQVQLEQWRKRQ
jgi:hypothetical protein